MSRMLAIPRKTSTVKPSKAHLIPDDMHISLRGMQPEGFDNSNIISFFCNKQLQVFVLVHDLGLSV